MSDAWCRIEIASANCPPGLDFVDVLARVIVDVRRHGYHAVVSSSSEAVSSLLELTGLARELQWQAETGEHPVHVEE